MPTPDSPSDWQAITDLQAELKQRGVVLPKSMMPLDDIDNTLFRFLRARKMDISAAADMLANTVDWRRTEKIEQTLEAFLPDGKDNIIRQYLPSAFLGFDKSGSPVWMEHAAAVDVPAMEAAGISLEDYVYYHCRAMEYMVNCKYSEATERAGHSVNNHCVILDLAGLRMNMLNQNTMKVFKAMSTIYQDHYPELMTRMFLVNIPFMFAAVWKVLQIFVDDRVKAKIRFLRKADFHILHEFVDRDILPDSLGGKVKGKVLSDKQGFLPPSLLAVNAEVQRRIDAKQQVQQQQEQQPPEQQPAQASQQPHQQQQQLQQPVLVQLRDQQQPHLAPAMPSQTAADMPVSRLSSDSIAPELLRPASLVASSSISSDMSSGSSSPVHRLQLGSSNPAALSDSELVKLGEVGRQPSQTASNSAVPLVVLPSQVFEALGGGDAAQERGKRSKREKARGLFSSFTGKQRSKHKAAQEDMDKALQMLAEMRRTESSPNVEAEALKRNKGGGGPWMSFTRQRRPPKPRSAKKGPATPRKGSPLATVTSGHVSLPSGGSPDAAAFVVRANDHGGAEADRHSHSKWKPFCMKAPMVHDDGDIEGHVGPQDSRLPKAALLQAQAPPGTLSQRLASKISAIPAYLKTADDADSFRLASPEGSSASLTGSAGSYSLQGEVVGRYASAPNLVALATAANPETPVVYAAASGTRDQRRLSADLASSKSKTSSPLSHGPARKTVSFTSKPQFGQSVAATDDRASDSPQGEHATDTGSLTVLGHSAVRQSRQLRHLTKAISRHWVFLLVCTVNVAAMCMVFSRQASSYQLLHN